MMNEINAAICRQLREKAGLTQIALGHVLKISRYTIAKFESGRNQPTAEQMETMLETAKCSEEDVAEMICKVLSKRTGKRVGIDAENSDYRPTTPVVVAQEFLQEHPAMVADPMGRALSNDVASQQLMVAAVAKKNRNLLELTGECRKRVNGDGGTASAEV